MKKNLRNSAVILILMLFAAACISPIAADETQPSSSSEVATVVALTFQALTTPQVAETATSVPEPSTSLLPHSLYFLGRDDQSISQVYRLERDGRTQMQITSEPANVDDYDVSPADGSVAYITNNQLLLIDADGSNGRLLLDGGSRENNPWVTRPVFSPDGGTLAYGREGLNLFNLSTGVSSLVIPNQYGEPLPGGALFPIEIYEPVSYSPDGRKLLLALGHWEALPSHAVYDPAANVLVRYTEVKDYIYCCSFHGGPVWAPDSSSFYGVASVHDTGYQFGELWRVDAGNGGATRIFNSPLGENTGGTVYLPVEPFAAPDGRLYFFFGTYGIDSGFFDAPVLELVRSASDGVTDRTVLRDENFALMDEALWAPDASFVIVATLPEMKWDQGGGVLALYYTDGQKDATWLAPYGRQLKWGP